jgi:agmatinase
MHTFDPSAAAQPGSGIYGLPSTREEAAIHVLPVPFDATASYRKGAWKGPDAILRASRQVDLFDALTGRPYEDGIWMAPAPAGIERLNEEASRLADAIIAHGGDLGAAPHLAADLERVNAIGAQVNALVHAETARSLGQNKLPVLVGGDHSTPFGAIQACAERFPGLGVLHFDAHADLRSAYEGFEWSHASIMENVARRLPAVAKLVQVGIRDFSEDEYELSRTSNGRIVTLYDRNWQHARLSGGERTLLVVREHLSQLPRDIYVSFDIDGLDPALCPNTGTPVPGGLSWADAMLWLEELSRAGKRVVGLDLNEVNPGDAGPDEDSWDAMVGARLLYRMIGVALMTRD